MYTISITAMCWCTIHFGASCHCEYLHFNSILQGEKGQKGSAGARGDPGHAGAIGDPGPPGSDGNDGADVSGSYMKCNSLCNGNRGDQQLPDSEGGAQGQGCKS